MLRTSKRQASRTTQTRRIAIQMGLCAALAGSALSPLAGAQAADAPARFVPFSVFAHDLTAAHSAAFVGRADTAVKSDAAFEEMRAHLIKLYGGISVPQSFLRDGQMFDCIRYQDQPALRSTGLRGMASPPPMSPQVALKLPARPGDGQVGSEARQAPNACGAGTFPMQRLTLDRLAKFGTLQAFFAKGPNGAGQAHVEGGLHPLNTGGHAYAHAYQFVNNYGGTSSLGLFRPYVYTSSSEVFSLEQQWYVGGSGTGEQTAEIGWQNYPAKYGTQNSVLFAYYTADGYHSTGCYNYDCGAFVQSSSSTIHLGSTFTAYSTVGGAQYSISVGYYLYAGNWWLAYGDQWVGYYPGSVYRGGQLTRYATEIDFGTESVGSYVWPGEGSGQWASSGYPYSSYVRTILYRDSANGGHYPSLTTSQPSPSCYSATPQTWGGSTWQYYFYVGGPGGYGC